VQFDALNGRVKGIVDEINTHREAVNEGRRRRNESLTKQQQLGYVELLDYDDKLKKHSRNATSGRINMDIDKIVDEINEIEQSIEASRARGVGDGINADAWGQLAKLRSFLTDGGQNAVN
jgi:hypothetical protein